MAPVKAKIKVRPPCQDLHTIMRIVFYIVDICIYRNYIRIMEKKMGITIAYWCYIGDSGKSMETTKVGIISRNTL